MPAVNLLQLRKEITTLLWKFTDPDGFRAELKKLLEQYEILSFRQGYGVLSSYQTPELRVPQLVIRELELALYQTVREQPQAALSLCDALWHDANLEMHTIATRMLGQIPIEFSDDVFNRIDQWSHQGLETSELRVFIRNAGTQLRQKQADKLLLQAQKWCAGNPKDQEIGLETMIFLLEDPRFLNLPAIFKTLEELLPTATTLQQGEITELLEMLLQKSRVETSYFVRQNLEQSPSRILLRVARRLLPSFSDQSRPAIQKILRSHPAGRES